jgi:hypothetical protein
VACAALLADSLALFVAVSWDFLPLFLRSIARARAGFAPVGGWGWLVFGNL